MEMELDVSKTLAEKRLSLAEETILAQEIGVKDLEITDVSLSSTRLYALLPFVRSGLPALHLLFLMHMLGRCPFVFRQHPRARSGPVYHPFDKPLVLLFLPIPPFCARRS